MSSIHHIRNCFEADKVLYSRHARYEMENEEFGKIRDHEVYEAVASGEIIENYPDDKPYPSMLIFGNTLEKRPIHVVCAYNSEEDMTVVVTVYHPDADLWIDLRRRKRP